MADQLSQSRNEALRKLADDLASGKVVLALGNDYPDYPLHEVERELAAFLHATLSETAGTAWQAQAYAKLGVVRDMMTPEDVLTVQQFIGPLPAFPTEKKERT